MRAAAHRPTSRTTCEAQDPEAQVSNGRRSYLRYDDNIVTVGPDGNRPCSIRVEGLDSDIATARMCSWGRLLPGSPASGSSGSPGGPDGNQVMRQDVNHRRYA